MQAANDEERGGGSRTWNPKGQGLEQAPCFYVYIRSISRLESGHMKSRSPKCT